MDIGLFDSVFLSSARNDRCPQHSAPVNERTSGRMSADVKKSDLHNVRLVWRAITDRRNLFRIAPHSVPLALRIPTYPLKYIPVHGLFCSDLIGRTLCCVRHSKTYQKWTWRSSDPILICRVLSIHMITVAALKLRYVIVISFFFYSLFSLLKPSEPRCCE